MNETVKATYKEEEYTREMRAYMAYFQSLEEVFELSIIDSFVDFGCNNARLLEAIHKKYPSAEVTGYDYFEWSKQHADESIKDKIIIDDLSKPHTFSRTYALVNCSEVGEHIPREAEDTFIDNITKAASDIVLLTWSDEYDTEGQHLNPRPKKYIIQKMKKRGFSYWEDVTERFSDTLANKLEGIGSNWWADNMMVFKKNKFAHTHSSYFIQGASTDNINHKTLLNKKGLITKSLQESFVELIDFIHTRTANKKGGSILRLGDGDYFFLRQIPIGSADPGRRALTVGYDKIDVNLYRNLFWQNDLITLSLEKKYRKSWLLFIVVDFVEKVISRVILKRPISPTSNGRRSYLIDKALSSLTVFGVLPSVIAHIYSFKRKNLYLSKADAIIKNEPLPLEAVYALISTKWIFRNFKNEIGIIASENKINLIKELMNHKEYKDYLGTEVFTDYIAIPEKGAADDILKLSETVGNQIKNSKAKIFLIGAGSAKIGLMPYLKHYHNAVFIDVGAGIDAIAGIVCQDRPYFAEWHNYRLRDHDYTKIDIMDKGNPEWNNKNYKTITM